MSTDVNYNIKGTSDVPQQVDKAKKAMSSLDQTTAAVTKKFSEIGKDIFLGFFAPVMLIHQAIGAIGAAIEKAKQDAKDAVDFAAGVKLEDTNKSPVDLTTRYLAQKLQLDLRTETEKKQAALAKTTVTEEFLKKDQRGKMITQEFAPLLRDVETGLMPANVEGSLAMIGQVQERVFALVNEEMKKALADEKAKAEAEKQKTAKEPGLFAGDNATFGVGNSPQMNILNQQVELQKQANEYLAVIAAAANGPQDFTKDTTGGMASSVNYKDYSNIS